MQTSPEPTDGIVRIRPTRSADAEAVYPAVRESIAELSPWAAWCGLDYSMAECKSWLGSRDEARANGDEFDFAVLDAREEVFLGACGLNQVNRVHNFANLGYWVRTGRTGQGIATAAVRLVARFGFETLGLTRLEVVVAVANVASQRVAEKAGATREGILRNRHVVRDMIYDSVMFSLIPGDYDSSTGSETHRTH